MTAKITLEFTLGEDPAAPMVGASSTWHATGVDSHEIPVFAMAAVLGLVRMQILEELREEFGEYANEQITQQIASTNARLAVVHEVMHLPDVPYDGVELTL